MPADRGNSNSTVASEMKPFGIDATGMVTGVGLDAASSCAAIRCGITGFEETKFMFGGDWLVGCEVPSEDRLLGREKLLWMVSSAIRECFSGKSSALDDVPLLVCLSDSSRPGSVAGPDREFLKDLGELLGRHLHPSSRVFAKGKMGGIHALDHARVLLGKEVRSCIIAGVDTHLDPRNLDALDRAGRLHTEQTTHGLSPGEAAGAVILSAYPANNALICHGIGWGREEAVVESGKPLRADGLAGAIRAAFADSGFGFERVDFRLTDLSGEPYFFKEAALAALRTMRVLKREFDIWHPADCIGDVGAATVPILLGVALTAMRKGYAPGAGVLCHLSNDDSQRAALTLLYQDERSN